MHLGPRCGSNYWTNTRTMRKINSVCESTLTPYSCVSLKCGYEFLRTVRKLLIWKFDLELTIVLSVVQVQLWKKDISCSELAGLLLCLSAITLCDCTFWNMSIYYLWIWTNRKQADTRFVFLETCRIPTRSCPILSSCRCNALKSRNLVGTACEGFLLLYCFITFSWSGKIRTHFRK